MSETLGSQQQQSHSGDDAFTLELRATLGSYLAQEWMDKTPSLRSFLITDDDDDDSVSVLLEYLTPSLRQYVEFVYRGRGDAQVTVVARDSFQGSVNTAWQLVLEANHGRRDAAMAAMLLEAYHYAGNHITFDCGAELFFCALKLL